MSQKGFLDKKGQPFCPPMGTYVDVKTTSSVTVGKESKFEKYFRFGREKTKHPSARTSNKNNPF
jgi:hypothetical protein